MQEKFAHFFASRRMPYAIIMLALVYYCIFLLRPYWLFRDSAMYYILGRSLAQGHGYLDPLTFPARLHTFYPPGYPFMLSLVMRFFGDTLLALRIASIFFTGASLVVLERLLHKILARKEAMLILLLFAFSPLLLEFVHTVSSEAAYFLFSWLTLYLLIEEKDSFLTVRVLLATCTAITAFYLRSVGLSLCIALVVYLLIRRKYAHALAAFALLSIALFPWLARMLTFSDTYAQNIMRKDYYDSLQGGMHLVDLPLRVLFNLKYYLGSVVGDLLFFPFLREVTYGNTLFPVKIGISAAFSFLFAKGFFAALKKRLGITEVYLMVYSAPLLLHSFHSERFLLPIYPFLLMYMLASVKYSKLPSLKIPIVFVLAVSAFFAHILIVRNTLKPAHTLGDSYAQAFSWITHNTPAQAVIMSSEHAAVYIYTQRKAVAWDLHPYDASLSMHSLQQNKVQYLIVSLEQGLTLRGKKVPGLEQSIAPILERFPGYLAPVYQSAVKPQVYVYKVKD